jgi:hypothetical protein
LSDKANVPIAVFWYPEVLLASAVFQRAVLENPFVLAFKVLAPLAVLKKPLVLAARLEFQIAVLLIILLFPLPTVTPLIRASPATSRVAFGVFVQIPSLEVASSQ